ncbi:substrate-binding domain-containing protein [Inquilinus sp. CA228]|uniref:substrate-binding domain-containing protein n=1 Tax=Inquilinus sp. CA228 TaxID=3455609 RepID=UPI003F8D34DC
MKRFSSRLCLAALAAGGLLSGTTQAPAAALYSGGSSAAFGLYLRWFQETNGGLTLLNCNPSEVLTGGGTRTCVVYAPVGSGAGLAAFLNQQSPSALPSDWPYESPFIPYDETFTPHIGVGYGAGREFFDFAGSDSVLTTAQIFAYNSATGPRSARGPAIQIPAAGMPVAIAFNTTGLTLHPSRIVPAGGSPSAKMTIGGSGRLYLSRRAYCGIFAGTITNWNDPVLTEDNLGQPLVTASTPIRVVVRQESSGTTFLLSRHLETVCNGGVDTSHPVVPGPLANYGFGVGTVVSWPTTFVKATGDNGVATAVASTTGAIGYVGPTYTQQAIAPEVSPAPVAANLQTRDSFEHGQSPAVVKPIPPAPTHTQNAVDSFVVPTTPNVSNWSAALDTAALHNPPNDATNPIDPANPQAYPIVGFTLLDFYTCYFPASETAAIRKFITDYTNGGVYDVAARNRGFAPLPPSVKTAVKTLALNNTLTSIHTGPIPGTCTISSGS